MPETTAALPNALSSAILLPAAMISGAPLTAPSAELLNLIAFVLVFAVASVSLTEGALRPPSGETALLSIQEMRLAPILPHLILAEAPTGQMMAGGYISLIAVV